MLELFKAALWVISISNIIADESDLVVHTPLGSVKGFSRITNDGRNYRAFEGIPYGKPPLGDLRFEPPQRYGSWEGTLLAEGYGPKCLQYPMHAPQQPPQEIAEKIVGSEDCLFLNIYTPLVDNHGNSTKLPVFFWIHGGGFQSLGPNDYGSNYIMNRDLIYVSINYRLGPLGFLSTGDGVVPGNMGLKDQSMALRWVSENIEAFGGDPNRITIAGQSAGGRSVLHHYLSPWSRGLFQNGMSFSGTAVNRWMQTENAAEQAKKLGLLQGCPTDSNQKMVECLKSRPAGSIAQSLRHFQPWYYNPFTPFGPVVERNSSEPFIDRSPVDIITSGDAADVPWMTSVVSEEGLFPAAEFVDNKNLMAELDESWEDIAPHLLNFNFTIPRSKHAEVATTIRKHYLGDKKIEEATARPLIHMIGDRLYGVDGEKAARLMAEANKNPVWFYYYSYRNTFSSSQLLGTDKDFGVSHGDDANLFIINLAFPEITDQPTLEVQNVLLNIVESFVYNGKPSVGIDWPVVDPSKEYLEYLHIAGPGQLSVERDTNFAEKEFWSSIPLNPSE